VDHEHQQTLTGYQQIASILANSITTMHELPDRTRQPTPSPPRPRRTAARPGEDLLYILNGGGLVCV